MIDSTSIVARPISLNPTRRGPFQWKCFAQSSVRGLNKRVSRALLTQGNYVSGLAGAASLLTTIVSVDPVYVYADIDENSLLKFNNLAHARKLETDVKRLAGN